MTDGDYSYELECAETGERHVLVHKGGVHTADGVVQTDPIVQMLMDAYVDLFYSYQEHLSHLEANNEIEVCSDCSPLVHPGSSRSH